MAQKLILPINEMRVTAGVKTIDEVPEHLQINVTKLLKK